MLKTRIIEILKANLPDEKGEEALGHAADAVVDLYVSTMSEGIAKAIKAYEGEPKEIE